MTTAITSPDINDKKNWVQEGDNGKKVGDIIDTKIIAEMEWNISELHNAITKNSKVWSWGANRFCQEVTAKVYSFKVQGFLLKGKVFISLAWDDTFTVYFTKPQGKIVNIIKGVYLEDLIDTIDQEVETKNNYADRR